MWQAPLPCWSISTSRASPSQSMRTSRTYWRSPEVSPFCQYSCRLRRPEPGPPGLERAPERLVVHVGDHEHVAVRSASWTTATTRPRRSPNLHHASTEPRRSRSHRPPLTGTAPSRRRCAPRRRRGCRARARSTYSSPCDLDLEAVLGVEEHLVADLDGSHVGSDGHRLAHMSRLAIWAVAGMRIPARERRSPSASPTWTRTRSKQDGDRLAVDAGRLLGASLHGTA